jgi:hypothetical protein
VVRPKLRKLDRDECGLIDFALHSYFGSLKWFNEERDARIPEEVRQVRAELRVDAAVYDGVVKFLK